MGRLFNSRNSATEKILFDDEFGAIQIKRTRGAIISLKPKTDGTMVASLPYFVPIREIRKLLDANRVILRKSRAKITKGKVYQDGDLVGKSHKLRIGIRSEESVKLRGLEIWVTVARQTSELERVQLVKNGVAKALRKEAKAYLPRRLKHLAETSGFHYEKVRFTHAKSRWGSCSTNGTISLNIMLMTLPNELIDYVLLHELTHTEHMNHSDKFWQSLENVCSGAKRKRREIKQFSPYL